MRGKEDAEDPREDESLMSGQSGISSVSWIEARDWRFYCSIGIAGVVVATIVVVGIVLTSTDIQYKGRHNLGDQNKDKGEAGFPAIGYKGVVAADVPQCSEMGLDILKKGGNAVDASVTTLLCQGAINAFASGIGGGGFFTVRTPNGTIEVVDCRETAPAAASRDMFNGSQTLAQVGGLAVGVPGEIRGLAAVHERYGELLWTEVVQPVADLCHNGFTVPYYLAKKLEENKDYILANSAWADVYTKPVGGSKKGKRELVVEGDTVHHPALGYTLGNISTHGPDAFYTGFIADALVADIAAAGGIFTAEDLANYTVQWREPVSTYYLGLKVSAPPAPASGPVLAYVLNILEEYNPAATGATPVTMQKVVEAFKFAYAARSYLGDPAFVDISEVVDDMLSKDYAGETRQKIVTGKTFDPSYYGANYSVQDTPGTTHVSVLDSDGYAVAVTSTINLSFGSKVYSGSTGIVLNNEMDDFSSPGFPNYFGVPPSPANFIEPGKRPLSSSAPTIVERNGEVALVVGASGGTKITTATAQVMLNTLSFGNGVFDAVVKPRLHEQLYPNILYLEPLFPVTDTSYFYTCGYNIEKLADLAVVQAITRSNDGKMVGASDPRKHGQAAAY